MTKKIVTDRLMKAIRTYCNVIYVVNWEPVQIND